MRNTDDVVMTPVLEILRNTRESCDFGEAPLFEDDPDANAEWWEYLMRSKADDSGFGALLDAILANGFDFDSPIGWQPSQGYISEGHHRLTAAILLCLDEVPTSHWGGGDGSVCAHDCGPHCGSALDSYQVFL